MKSRRSRWVVGVFLILAGCSTAQPPRPQPVLLNTAPDASKPIYPESSSKTISLVERKILRAKGNLVTVSKKLLRELIEEEKLSESKRGKLSAQLEALKKVDREEAQKAVP